MERQTSKQATPPIDLPIGSKVPPILLYFHPSMKRLAEQVVRTIAQEHPTKTSMDETDVNIMHCVLLVYNAIWLNVYLMVFKVMTNSRLLQLGLQRLKDDKKSTT